MLNQQGKLRSGNVTVLLPRKLQSLEDRLHLVRQASVRRRIHPFRYTPMHKLSHHTSELRTL